MPAGMGWGGLDSEFRRGVPGGGSVKPMPPCWPPGSLGPVPGGLDGATAWPLRGAPWASMNGMGSIGVPSWRTSKCRWFPVLVPVVPSTPSCCPIHTGAPGVMSALIEARWA